MKKTPTSLGRVIASVATFAVSSTLLPGVTITSLGTGTGALLGGDLTDPEDDGDDRRDPLVPGDGLAERNWDFVDAVANEKSSFADHEAAFNVFDNKLGPGQDKWCCNAREITVEFEAAVSLTHFTLSSANDVPGRDWREWTVSGSTDGTTFTEIYADDGSVNHWPNRLEVVQFELDAPTPEYTHFRFEATSNRGDGLWQIGEIELFGQLDNTDTDGDMLPDWWEVANLPAGAELDDGSVNPDFGKDGDSDNDSLTNLEEFNRGTDPQNEDTDGDGLSDGVEDGEGAFVSAEMTGSHPKNEDTDGDGLTDGDEVLVHNTDPNKQDTDEDGASDAIEIAQGTNPNNPNDLPILWTVRNATSSSALNTIQDVRDLFGPNGSIIEETTTSAEFINFRENANGPFPNAEAFPVIGTQNGDTNDFAILATGPLLIEEDGTYTFGFNSDDGGGFWIDGEPVVIFDQNRGSATSVGAVDLAAGPHEMEFIYWERGGGAQVQLFMHNEIGDFTADPTDNAAIVANYSLLAVSAGKSVDDPLKLNVVRTGGQLEISWDSQPGKLYDLLSDLDLQPEPASWESWEGNVMIPATPPRNSLTIDLPSDPSRYFAVTEYPTPPTVVYSDDFESGQGGWTISGGPTPWEIGAPDPSVAGGPGAAFSGANVFGTDLDGGYAEDTDSVLLSPPIDLSVVVDATLVFQMWTDIEMTFDLASIRLLDAADDSEIAILEDVIDGTITEWQEESFDLPAEAIGKSVKIEFRLVADDFNPNPQAGIYIDDVRIEGSAP